jgi:hypothetical protein
MERQNTAFHSKKKQLRQFCTLRFDDNRQDARLLRRRRANTKGTEAKTRVTKIGFLLRDLFLGHRDWSLR